MFEERLFAAIRLLTRVNGDAPRSRPMRIDKQGRMTWDERSILISTALAHEDVDVRYDDARPLGCCLRSSLRRSALRT
jgi:hypothetical protein